MLEQVYVPDLRHKALYTLSVVERVREDRLWLVQTAYTLAQEEMCSGIQCVPEHHIKRIDLLTLGDLGHEDLGVLFEDVDVAEAVLDELRSDQLA